MSVTLNIQMGGYSILKRIVKFTVVFVVAAALAAAIVFFDFSANEMRFVTVSSDCLLYTSRCV